MEDIGIKDITRVIDAIRGSSGVDFSNYAFSSFKRRIIRFIEVNKIRDIDVFVEKIKADISYTESLIREITVNVTEMFRDPSFWIMLRDTVLPQIMNNNSFKIWHAACSSGEEVYSMTILLRESGLLKSSKIIATDLNDNVLKVAKNGVYSLKSQEINIKNYDRFGGKGKLSDYYSVYENTVQYDKSLIENVDFRCHNLTQSEQMTPFDLIICRNVLIYFNSDLQEKVVNTFNNSMFPGSFLAVGSKESINWCKAAGHFKEISFEEKIYLKTS